MAQETATSISVKIIALLKLQIGNISETIEQQGMTIFGGNNNLLSTDEISDFCLEFLQLLVELLQSKNPHDDTSPQFHAMEKYFKNLSKQLLIRGGRVEDLVRFIQFMQGTLIKALSDDKKNISVDDARDALLFLSSTFRLYYDLSSLALIDPVYYEWLDRLARTVKALNVAMVCIHMQPTAAFGMAQFLQGMPVFETALDISGWKKTST